MPWARALLSGLFLSCSVFSNETIRLTNGEWPPFLSENLAHHGYASHLVSEAFATVGVEVEYGFFPWKRSFQYAKDGISSSGEIWHGSVVWMYNEERAKVFTYSDVLMTDHQVLFYLHSNPVEWNVVDDLNGKTIGGTLHTYYPLLEYADKKGIIRLERARDYQTLFTRLLAGRIDAVPHNYSVGLYFINNHLSEEQRERVTYSPTEMHKNPYYLILSNNIPENQKYKKLFNQGLKNIKANGTYRKLQNNLEQGMYDRPLVNE
ncbi:substrate-binding periplasmic protein [Vibrio sp. HN007]|uniref:substrate-binding periplasmic protein n=1 Tax=Vibrio iocasae TaxID=3098914 RepID=UPI0035D47CF1